MYTSLRGYGCGKRLLLTSMLHRFGKREFLLREAATLPGFSIGAFRRLAGDGLVVPSLGANPYRWHIASAVAAAADRRVVLADVRVATDRAQDGCS